MKITKTPSIADGYSFGGYPLSFKDCQRHFLLAGSNGSGKTCCIRLLMQSATWQMAYGERNVRMLVYDSKTDMASYLAGMDGVSTDQLKILHPMDARCSAWDMAADYDNDMYIEELANTIIPYDKNQAGDNAYFFIGAQKILTATILMLNSFLPGRWQLRDILLATESMDQLKRLLRACPQTAHILDQTFHKIDTAYEVKSTMDAYLSPLRPIAAAWHQASLERSPISIKSWIEGNGDILLMGNGPKAKAGLQLVNQLLFAEAAKAVRSVPGEPEDQASFFFLDELSELGHLPGLRDLLITGRSKSAPVVMGFQAIEGIDDAYGKDLSRELLGQAQNVGFLHINPPSFFTAEWASQVVGRWEFFRLTQQWQQSSGQGGKSSSYSINEDYQEEDRWLPSQFATDLPIPGTDRGVTGLFRIRPGVIHPDHAPLETGWVRTEIPRNIIFGKDGDLSRLRDSKSGFDNFVPRDVSHFTLSNWSPKEAARLKGPIWDIVSEDISAELHNRAVAQLPEPETQSNARPGNPTRKIYPKTDDADDSPADVNPFPKM